jgi:hypothetical protein
MPISFAAQPGTRAKAPQVLFGFADFPTGTPCKWNVSLFAKIGQPVQLAREKILFVPLAFVVWMTDVRMRSLWTKAPVAMMINVNPACAPSRRVL